MVSAVANPIPRTKWPSALILTPLEQDVDACRNAKTGQIDRVEIDEVAAQFPGRRRVAALQAAIKSLVQFDVDAAEDMRGWRPTLRAKGLWKYGEVLKIDEVADLIELIVDHPAARAGVWHDAVGDPRQATDVVPFR